MQFAVVAALFAGAAMAWESTTYVTDVITITSCAASVTNCPARSTITSTTSHAVVLTGTRTATITGTITSCAASITNCPAKSHTYVNATTPIAATSPISVVQSKPVVPSVVTITVSACPTTLAPHKSSIIPTGTGSPAPPKNSTTPTTPSSPKFTGAASTIGGSLAFAGVAAIAAFFL